MKYLTLFTVILLIITFAMKYALDLPIVQYNIDTGKCVRVIPKGSCDYLPFKYDAQPIEDR